jgi:hypothetical protein
MLAGGEPLAKIHIELAGTMFSVTTGSDGSSRLIAISPGSYTLDVSGLGYRTERIAFQISTSQDIREFQISLAPDDFKRSDSIQVTTNVFESLDWPAPGDLTLTTSELRETSSVLANDPFDQFRHSLEFPLRVTMTSSPSSEQASPFSSPTNFYPSHPRPASSSISRARQERVLPRLSLKNCLSSTHAFARQTRPLQRRHLFA